MSKDQKKTIKIDVETVEEIKNTFEWISSTLTFWKLDEFFPVNLIKKVCDDFFVSVSHIIDK